MAGMTSQPLKCRSAGHSDGSVGCLDSKTWSGLAVEFMASDMVLLFSSEIVYDCIILLQNYVIDGYLDTNSISIIVRYKVPYFLCV